MNTLFDSIALGCQPYIQELAKLEQPAHLKFSKFRDSDYKNANPSKTYHPSHSGWLYIDARINKFWLYITHSEEVVFRRRISGKESLTERVVKNLSFYTGLIVDNTLTSQVFREMVIKRVHDSTPGREADIIALHDQLHSQFAKYVSKPSRVLSTRVKGKRNPVEMVQLAYYMDFYKLLKVLKDDYKVHTLFHYVAKFLKHLHAIKLVHGDVKPPNFLIEIESDLVDQAILSGIKATDFEHTSETFYVHKPIDILYCYFDKIRLTKGVATNMTDDWAFLFSYGNWQLQGRLELAYKEYKGLNYAQFMLLIGDVLKEKFWISETEWSARSETNFLDILQTKKDSLPTKAQAIIAYAEKMKKAFYILDRMDEILEKDYGIGSGIVILNAKRKADNASARDRNVESDPLFQLLTEKSLLIKEELSSVQFRPEELSDFMKELILREK